MKKLFTFLTMFVILNSVFSQSWIKKYPYNPPQIYGQPYYSLWEADNLWLINSSYGLTTRRSFDGGNSWVQTSAPFSAGNLSSFKAVNSTTAWAVEQGTVSHQYALYFTTDGGNTWTKKLDITNLRFVHFFDNSHGVAVADESYGGIGDSVYSTNDGGNNWTLLPSGNGPVTSGSPDRWYRVRDNVLYYWTPVVSGGIKRKLIKSTDFGVTRTLLPALFKDWSMMTWKNGNEGIVLEHTPSYSSLNSITINRTTDGGLTWSVVTNAPSGLPIPFSGGIEYIPGTDYLLITGPADTSVNSQKGTWISADHGATWTAIDQGTHHSGLQCADNQNCYSFGWNQTEGVFLYKLNFAGLATIETPIKDTDLAFFPNPVEDILQINTEEKLDSYQVITADGRLVRSGDFKGSSYTVQMQGLSTGTYYVKVKGEKFSTAEKVVKK